MSRHLSILLIVLATLAGCAKPASEAPASAGTGGQGEAKLSDANRFLAYEHSIYLQVEEDKVAPAVRRRPNGVPRGGRGILRGPGSPCIQW